MTTLKPRIDLPKSQDFPWRATGNLLASIALAISLSHPAAADSITVTVPSFLNFNVTDVTRSTNASPSPFIVAFSNAILNSDEAVRISVQATAPQLTPPAGPSIPVTNVTWTASNAVNGSGASGTLRSDSSTQVFLASPNATSGSVDLSWTLAAPGAGVRAGSHTLSLTWKIEAVSP